MLFQQLFAYIVWHPIFKMKGGGSFSLSSKVFI